MNAENEQEMLDRLCSGAGNIINMLKSVLSGENGVNYAQLLLYASGLAGHACQRAVMANNEPSVRIETEDGRNYYFGDELNAYLLEGKYSVLSFINGIYVNKTGKEAPDPAPLIQRAVSLIGKDDYKIWNGFLPDDAYKIVKPCFDGIYENMTRRYCASPSEWSVLFGIVLQNIMAMAMTPEKADDVYQMALECALFVSKMRDDSLIQR